MATFDAPSTSGLVFQKHPKGKALTSSAKRIILNVYVKVSEEHHGESHTFWAKRTSDLTGVSKETVFDVKKEIADNGCLRTPGKKRPKARGKRTRNERYDDFTMNAIRRKVHDFFRKNEIPTIKKVLAEINSDDDLPKMSWSTVRRILKDLGFAYATRTRNSSLIERDDIALWRRRYLRAIMQHRKEGRSVYYSDETWVNAGHTKSKVYQDTTVNSARQAVLAGLTTGLKAPSGKGARLIMTHAGNEEGFVAGALEIFHARKAKGDYHEEMDGRHYEKWFEEKLLPNLKPNSVIVIDNAPYHSVRLESIPSSGTRKAEIQSWLTSKGIPWSAEMIKAELLAEVARVKPLYEQYRIDALASQHGHTVLRLPPYHCELNPIELIWAQVKGYVAANNTSFKIADAEKLTTEGFNRVSVEHWKNCVKHVLTEEEKMWNLDGMADIVVEKLQFNIGGTSESDTSNLSGIEEL